MKTNKQIGSKRSPSDDEIRQECENTLAVMAEYAPSKVGVFRKAYAGGSLRAAVDAKCLECVSHSTGAVRGCMTVTCPIWAVRPYKKVRS